MINLFHKQTEIPCYAGLLDRYAVMCPAGSEGTSYALLTTVSNVAYEVAYAVGDMLTGEFKGKGRMTPTLPRKYFKIPFWFCIGISIEILIG